MDESALEVRDEITGPWTSAVARYFIHPDWRAAAAGETEGAFTFGAHRVGWTIDGGRGELVESTYHPEFGLSVANRCLQVTARQDRLSVRFRWGA